MRAQMPIISVRPTHHSWSLKRRGNSASGLGSSPAIGSQQLGHQKNAATPSQWSVPHTHAQAFQRPRGARANPPPWADGAQPWPHAQTQMRCAFMINGVVEVNFLKLAGALAGDEALTSTAGAAPRFGRAVACGEGGGA